MSAVLKCQTINKVVLVEVDQIKPNPAQPRIVFREAEIESLAESILANGLLQPLTVRRYPEHFELISGERRLRALKMAKIALAPCIIVDTTDRQAAVFALLENLQREDLNYFEEALAMKNLIVEWGVSQQELGARLGKAQPTIANKLRLLKFSSSMQRLLLENNLNERQARALLKLNREEQMRQAVEGIVSKNLNVMQTETFIETILGGRTTEKKEYRPIVKDVRIFLNTINHAIRLMNESGIQAISEKKENDGYIEYIVKIPVSNRKVECSVPSKS